ncbi:MAG: DsbA family protein [Paracoccaceae bacterium]|nr:DsbA family protein [Paracoccaceae bacterium]
MLRVLCLSFVLFASSISMATAFDIEAMTDNERAIFRSEVRDYLLENPEIILEVVALIEERRAQQAAEAELMLVADNFEEIFNDGHSYIGGNPDGDITVVEFLDYQCGFCKRAFPEVTALLEGDPNVRLIVKEFPILGEASVLASRYAIATKEVHGDEAYRGVHDSLMVARGGINEEALERLSDQMDLDHAAILEEMYSDDTAAIIEANRELASTLQVAGTPAFVIGDQIVRGFIELPQLREVVRQERADQG